MKNQWIICAVIAITSACSFSASAAEFKRNSSLPSEIQVLINARIAKACSGVQSIYEEETSFKEVEFDQGQFDTYYTTVLKGTYSHDGMHPSSVTIWVKAIDTNIRNPDFDRYDLISFESDAGSICQ